MTVAIILALAVFGAYWRRIKGGAWWMRDQGPWWAANGLIYLWLLLPVAGALFATCVIWWKALVMSALFTGSWNPGPAGLSIGRDPQDEITAAEAKPIGKFVVAIADAFAKPGGAAWCMWLLSLDYGVRTILMAIAGRYLIAPDFIWFGFAGFLAGPLYWLGWWIWDRGWRPVFMQPTPGEAGGHLIGEWLLGGALTGLFVAVAA